MSLSRVKKPFIPPTMGDVTPTTRQQVQQALGLTRRGTTRRKTRSGTTTRRKTRKGTRTTTRRKTGRLRKGSPEAKRRMAKLRGMQKRKRR